jgi:hypothetical protein
VTTPVSARAAAAEVPLCAPCVDHEGLCVWHAEHDYELMPLLREVSWHRKVHRGENDPALARPMIPSEERLPLGTAGRKAQSKLMRQLKGDYTKVRHPKAGLIS